MEASFSACFDELEKDANILGAVKKVLTDPIPGTKPWLIGRGVRGTPSASTVGKSAVKAAPTKTKQLGGGVYDVSGLARKMGVV